MAFLYKDIPEKIKAYRALVEQEGLHTQVEELANELIDMMEGELVAEGLIDANP